jgi:hypothetical protein
MGNQRIQKKYGDYGRIEFGKGAGKQLIIAVAVQEQ